MQTNEVRLHHPFFGRSDVDLDLLAASSSLPFLWAECSQQAEANIHYYPQHDAINPALVHAGSTALGYLSSIDTTTHVASEASDQTGQGALGSDHVGKAAVPVRNDAKDGSLPRRRAQSSTQQSLKIEQFMPELAEMRRSKSRPRSRKNVLKCDKTPKAIIKVDKRGVMQGMFQTFGSHQIVRRRMNDDERSASAMTRHLGACDRCRQLKARVRESLHAVRSLSQVAAVSQSWRLYAPGHGSTTNNNLINWMRQKQSENCLLPADVAHRGLLTDEAPRVIHLTQDVGYTLPVTVSTFLPDSGDITGYSWKDSAGNNQKMEMPPYYIQDLDQAILDIQQYARSSRSSYISSLLDGHSKVVCGTFEAAFRFLEANESTLLSYMLSLWAATRLTERTWRVCAPDTFGFSPPTENDNPWKGIVPVTPIMDTQLDEIAIRALLVPLGNKVLQELDQQMKKNDRKSCYVHACKSLLSFFHFAYPGSVPLSSITDRSLDVSDLVTMEQAGYLRMVRDELLKQEDKLRDWRNSSMYSTPMYWTYQLFLHDWRGDIEHVTPVDDFTEEDFMTS
ncbi:hypothetical protein DL771_012350 [Monosporascus sp. 5C6A]|nr:hypothetical protein DL771_012350 [Monosporascus sp. 5C6A]